MIREYTEEFAFWFVLFFAFFLLYSGFKPLVKVVISNLPNRPFAGAKETLAV